MKYLYICQLLFILTQAEGEKAEYHKMTLDISITYDRKALERIYQYEKTVNFNSQSGEMVEKYMDHTGKIIDQFKSLDHITRDDQTQSSSISGENNNQNDSLNIQD